MSRYQKLTQKLESFLPGDLNYCFYSDSGSVAVEVSLKMALQYNTNQGRKRPLVLALEHAYHGDTFKAMEVGDDEDYHFAFDKKEGVSIFQLSPCTGRGLCKLSRSAELLYL